MATSVGWLYDVGAQVLLDNLLNTDGTTPLPGLTLSLNSSSVPMTPQDPNDSTYTEPTLSGYVPIYTAPDWGVVTGTGSATATLTAEEFDFDPYVGPAVTIYGWWLWQQDPDVLIFGGQISPPFVVPFGGGALQFDAIAVTLGQCGASGPFVLDTFTGANSTALTAHTMDDGRGWLAEIGTFWIQANKATAHSWNDNDQVVTDCGLSKYALLVDVVSYWTNSTNFDHVGTLIRYTDTNNWWLLDVDGDGSLVRLVKSVAGVISIVSTSAQSIPSGSTHTIGARCSADSITVTWDGGDLFTVVDSFSHYTTLVGLRVGKVGTPPNQGTWDNFRVNPF